MTILAGDIKLVASKVMDDVPEGGGGPTSVLIIDGASNNVFPDISELDRAGGRVALRKLHVSVQTDNTDTYLGSNIIVAEPPNDPNVTVTLFSTKDTFDLRESAKGRVESYLVRGPTWPGYLFENHIAGQRTVQLFQRPETELPPIGHTLAMVRDEGLSTELEQYVRVIRVSAVTRLFYDDETNQDFMATVVTCEISDKLRFDMPGSPPLRSFRRKDGATTTRDTVVADAGDYAGIVPLTVPVEIGDLSLKVSTIFTQIVPNSQTEIAITDMKPNGELAIFTQAGVPYTFNTSVALNRDFGMAIAQNVLPGSLKIDVYGVQLTDSGGRLFAGAVQVGLVDYNQGLITILDEAYNFDGYKTVTYTPAAAPLRSLSTASWVVTQETRASTLVTILDPPPAPGSMSVSYRAQGRWYTLRDTGTGQLVGSDVSFGTGTVSFVTGSVVLTLGALPDAGTNVLATFGLPTTDARRDGGAVLVQNVMQLGNTGVAPTTVTVTWKINEPDPTTGQPVLMPKTATDNGQGLLTGDATGTVDYIDGIVTIIPTVLPSVGVEFSVQYSWGEAFKEMFQAPERNPDGTIELLLGHPNVLPRSMRVVWNTVYNPNDLNVEGTISTVTSFASEITATRPWVPPPPAPIGAPRVDPIVTVKDNGLGTFATRPECAAVINYAAGSLKFHPETTIALPKPRWKNVLTGTTSYVAGTQEQVDVAAAVVNTVTTTATESEFTVVFDGFAYEVIGAEMPADESGYAIVTYRTTAAGTTNTEKFAFSPSVDLTEGNRDPIIPGSVSFTLGGTRYIDRQGKLYTNIDYATGSGQQVGSINYSLGVAALTLLAEGTANTGLVGSLVVTQALLPVTKVKFRTSTAPIRPGGFVVQFVVGSDSTQAVRTLTADTDGKISAPDVKGEIDYETGVVSLRFGSRVTALGNETAVWYDEGLVGTDGKIWRPYMVIADTIRYAASSYTYLPLDAGILGLDPVRLPQDGRVPIFRPGGYIVIGNTGKIGPAAVSNGQVLNCARTRLSRVRVLDAGGIVINTGYSANLEAGTVTFSDVSTYTQPVTVEHRIEDMMQVGDVQINGQLGVTRRATHAYPVPGSYVSSALMSLDLKSRVSAVFDQGSWNGFKWIDNLEGDPATSTFNDTLAPIKVTNAGATTERWALRFLTNTTFEVIGENVGIIATGTTGLDCAPLNPATGFPYFTVDYRGWGSGWAPGNILRINTVGALFPVWVLRTIQQGPEAGLDYNFTMLTRGDVNRP